MNLLKKGILALLTIGLVTSCDDDTLDTNPTGLSEITLSSFEATPGPDENGLEDGTFITVQPLAIGVSSYTVDFGDGSTPVTIAEPGGTSAKASHDYANEVEEVTYTITVTAKSDAGLADVSLTENLTVTHTVVPTINTVPASPSLRDANVFALFSNGFEYDGGILAWEHGTSASGGTPILVTENNDVVQLSRLGAESGVLSVSTIETANAFIEGVAAMRIHFDVHSDFAEGIDVLKVTLVNDDDSESYEIDGLALTDGDWTSFDFDLGADFSSAVDAIDEVVFELGTGGTANDHATIYVDNLYLYKDPTNVIINGEFEGSFDFWKFATFTDGTTNPYGSSSDGSDLDYDGNDTGGKTRGAKWSSSQSGGDLRSSNSRYAYQELLLEPETDYILQYQYAIKDDSGDDPIGGRRLVGLIMDGYYVDGADAVDDLASDNIGYHEGFIAEGKFSDTDGDVGTFVEIPFTTNEDGEVAIMFYAVTNKDAFIDNVKVFED